MSKQFYCIYIESSVANDAQVVFMITKQLFSNKFNARQVCDELNKNETEEGVVYKVLEMEVIE